MELAICGKDEKEKIKNLYMQAFDDNLDFVEYYFKNKFKDNRVVALEEENQLLSMLHLNPFQVNYNKRVYNTSYIVAVATDHRHRKKGYMGKIIEFTLNKLYQEREIFSLLMPIDSRIYERYGFGFIEDHLNLHCKTDTFMTEEVKFDARVARFQDIPFLVQQYKLFSEQFNLSTNRDEESFNRLLKEIGTDEGQIILFKDGYVMIYYDDKGILNIREICSNSDSTFYEILSYIKNKTNSTRVIIHDHCRSKVKYILPNIPENKIILKPFMMARIIHVEAFLIKNIALFRDDIRIKVTDHMIQANNRIYHLKDGKLRRFQEKELFDFELNIKQLTQLAFGYITSRELGINESKKELLRKNSRNNHFFNEYV